MEKPPSPQGSRPVRLERAQEASGGVGTHRQEPVEPESPPSG